MGSPEDEWPVAHHASSALSDQPVPSSSKIRNTATRSKWPQYASNLCGGYQTSSESGLQVPWRISFARKKVKRRNSDWSRPNRRRRWQRDLGIISDRDSWKNSGTFRFLNTSSNSTMNEGTPPIATSQSAGATATLPPTPSPTPHHSLSLILDVVFIFLSGLGIILGLLSVLYALVVLCDRYCRCAPRWAEWTDEMFSEWEAELGGNDSPTEEEDLAAAAEAYGPVALKARLWGLTLTERRAVLEEVFAKQYRKYTLATTKSLDMSSTSDDTTSTKPPELTHSASTDSERSAPEGKSAPTTYAESSSVASDFTYRRQLSDLEGGSSDRVVVSREPSLDIDDESSAQIPAHIRGKMLSGKEESSDDAIAELGAEAEVNATENQKISEEPSLDPLYFGERRVAASCAICLVEYSEGDKVLHGNHCFHIFHSNCIMAWMEDCHDDCPYCRVAMMKPDDMRRAATKVLSKERLQELSVGPRKWRRQRRVPEADPSTSETRESEPSASASGEAVGNDNVASELYPHLPPPSSEEIEVVSTESAFGQRMDRVIALPISRLGQHSRAQSSAGEVVNPFHW